MNVSINTLSGRRRRRIVCSALDYPIEKVHQLYLYSAADTVTPVERWKDKLAEEWTSAVIDGVIVHM